MLSSKKTVVYLTRDKIWVADFSTSKPGLAIVDWDGNDLTLVFKQIKNKLKTDSVKIILGNALSYVLCLELTAEDTTQAHILDKAGSAIPEDLSSHNISWKIVRKDSKNNLNLVQIFAVSPKILNNISYAAKINKLKIESINPVSLILALKTADFKEPHLILWADQEVLGVVAHMGTVYFSENILENTEQKIKNLITFAKDKFRLEISVENIISDWEASNAPKLASKWLSVKMSIKPLIITQNKFNKDKEILEIEPLQNPTNPQDSLLVDTKEQVKDSAIKAQPEAESEDQVEETVNKDIAQKDNDFWDLDDSEESPSFVKVLFIVFMIFSILIALATGIIFREKIIDRFLSYKDSANKQTDTSLVPSPTPEAAPASSPSAQVKLSDYLVQVLNGSGVPGEAIKVRDILKTEGFENVNTENADSYDYTETEIKLKKEVPKEVLTIIDKALNSEYQPVSSSETLTEDSKYDVVIIVGKKKD